MIDTTKFRQECKDKPTCTQSKTFQAEKQKHCIIICAQQNTILSVKEETSDLLTLPSYPDPQPNLKTPGEYKKYGPDDACFPWGESSSTDADNAPS